MEIGTLLTYSAVVLGFVFIPGPATMMTLARSTTSGARVGLMIGLGIAAGDAVHTVLAIIGISALLAASAVLFDVVKYAGAAYLVYLGVRAFIQKRPPAQSAGRLRIAPAAAWRQGFVAEVLNPKTSLFFLAFLPQFAGQNGWPIPLQMAVFGLIFVAFGLLSTVVFAVGAGCLGSFLRRNPAVLKWQGKVVGTIYVGLGVRLAIERQ